MADYGNPEFPLKSERLLVDCIYSSAVDPSRFENLIDSWDSRLRAAGFTLQNLAHLNNTEIADHIERADTVASQLASQPNARIVDLAVSRLETASFVCSAAGTIVAANKPAQGLFRIEAGKTTANLPLSPEGHAQFLASIDHVINSADGRHEILRLGSTTLKRSFFAFVRQIRDESGHAYALIVSTEQVWRKTVEAAIQRAFSFTPAEINVLRLIVSGAAVAEAAAALGRLESTIRSQIHSMLSKSGARSQAELMSLTLAFQDSTDEDRPANYTGPIRPPNAANNYRSIKLRDGRSLDYLLSGDGGGRPFIWLHGNLAQCRLPRPAEEWLTLQGLAMIVPVRAGYGYSSPTPAGCDAIETAIADIEELCRQLSVGAFPLVAYGNDFLLACRLALELPDRVCGIVGVGPVFAIDTAEEYARLNKWARFFRANARYAPKILNFLGRSTYSFVRTIGFGNYLDLVLRGTPDYTDLAEPEARTAIVAGMEIMWGDGVRCHEAFTADTVAVHRDPWPDLTRIAVPVTLIHGQQDSNVAHDSSAGRALQFGWEMISVPNAGGFLHYRHWQLVLETVARRLPPAQERIVRPSTK